LALGGITLAQHVHTVAGRYNILVGLHTDHCQATKLDKFVKPLIAETERRRAEGLPNLYNAHMFDGSELALGDNMRRSAELLKRCAASEIILEVEIGVVGGEEDGHDTSGVPKDKLYTTPEDMVAAHKALAPLGRYLLAATFGNVHGVYKPGNVVLKPSILKAGQDAIAAACAGQDRLGLLVPGDAGTPPLRIAPRRGRVAGLRLLETLAGLHPAEPTPAQPAPRSGAWFELTPGVVLLLPPGAMPSSAALQALSQAAAPLAAELHRQGLAPLRNPDGDSHV